MHIKRIQYVISTIYSLYPKKSQKKGTVEQGHFYRFMSFTRIELAPKQRAKKLE